MKVLFLGAEFMLPYWRPEIEELVAVNLQEPVEAQIEPHTDAAFAYAMNTMGGENVPKLQAARQYCQRHGIRTIWHTIEDPNSWGTFAPQSAGFDVVATSDAEKIADYQRLGARRVIWLPLAAQPALHVERPTSPAATDLVLIANWYTNDARLAAVRELLDPVLEAGHTLTLYAYPHPAWPEKYRKWWRGATSCYDVASHYPTGQIALGMNNQAFNTAMCSMRTFEVLACGKPFLSYWSDAYARLGFVNEEQAVGRGHFVWIHERTQATRWARDILAAPELAAAMAARGRDFVLAHHTYAERLRTVCGALDR